MPELLRATRVELKKKKRRMDSLEGHIVKLTAFKDQKVALEGEVAALDAIISGIVSEPKQVELNASTAIIKLRALYAQDITRLGISINGQRLRISAINDKVQADGDYNATEKQEFTDAKANEV